MLCTILFNTANQLIPRSFIPSIILFPLRKNDYLIPQGRKVG